VIHLYICLYVYTYVCMYYSGTFLEYLFIRFARISYGRFIAMRYKFKLSAYILEPLVIGQIETRKRRRTVQYQASLVTAVRVRVRWCVV
jgi:hypothetical protein